MLALLCACAHACLHACALVLVFSPYISIGTVAMPPLAASGAFRCAGARTDVIRVWSGRGC
eukprot:3806766-Alexandrium_andersonii.AAC.1